VKQGCGGCRVRSEFKNRTEQNRTGVHLSVTVSHERLYVCSSCSQASHVFKVSSRATAWDPKIMERLEQYGIYTLGELGLVKITLHLLRGFPGCQMRSVNGSCPAVLQSRSGPSGSRTRAELCRQPMPRLRDGTWTVLVNIMKWPGALLSWELSCYAAVTLRPLRLSDAR
jgi:hypothetical protein